MAALAWRRGGTGLLFVGRLGALACAPEIGKPARSSARITALGCGRGETSLTVGPLVQLGRNVACGSSVLGDAGERANGLAGPSAGERGNARRSWQVGRALAFWAGEHNGPWGEEAWAERGLLG